jgi:hypothetical protein
MGQYLIFLIAVFGLYACEEPSKKPQYVESTPKPVETKGPGGGPKTGGTGDLEEKGEDKSADIEEESDDETELDEFDKEPLPPATTPTKSLTASNGKPYCKNNGGLGYGSEFDCGGGLRCKKDDGTTFAESSICVVSTTSSLPATTGSSTASGYLTCMGNSYCNSGYGWLKSGESGCKSGVTGFQPDKNGCSCKC